MSRPGVRLTSGSSSTPICARPCCLGRKADNVATSAWLIALLGLWTGVSAFFGAGPYFYAWNDWIVGVIVALLGFFVVRGRPAAILAGIVGVWLFIAGFIPGLREGAGMWWNQILVGIALIILGYVAARGTTGTIEHPRAHPAV